MANFSPPTCLTRGPMTPLGFCSVCRWRDFAPECDADRLPRRAPVLPVITILRSGKGWWTLTFSPTASQAGFFLPKRVFLSLGHHTWRTPESAAPAAFNAPVKHTDAPQARAASRGEAWARPPRGEDAECERPTDKCPSCPRSTAIRSSTPSRSTPSARGPDTPRSAKGCVLIRSRRLTSIAGHTEHPGTG